MAPCRHQGESPSAVRPSLTGGHPAISRAAPQPAILGPYARSQDDGSDGGAASAVLLCARGRVLRDGARARARGGAGSPHPLLSAARPGARPHADARVDQHGDDGRALPLRAGAHQAPRAVSPPRRSAVGELRRRHDSADRWLLDRLLADRHRRRRHARHLGRPALREPLADAARGAAARGCGARRGLATTALVAAAILGTLLAADKQRGFLGGDVVTNLAAHAHLAALGWVGLTVCALSFRFLPAFLLPTAEVADAARRLVALLAAAVLALVA